MRMIPSIVVQKARLILELPGHVSSLFPAVCIMLSSHDVIKACGDPNVDRSDVQRKSDEQIAYFQAIWLSAYAISPRCISNVSDSCFSPF